MQIEKTQEFKSFKYKIIEVSMLNPHINTLVTYCNNPKKKIISLSVNLSPYKG